MNQNTFQRATVAQQYDFALQRIRLELGNTDDTTILANSDEELVQYFMDKWELEPLQEDPSRPKSASKTREFRESKHDALDFPMRKEVVFAEVEIPLIPRRSNDLTIQLVSESEWPSRRTLKETASYRQEDHVIALRTSQEQTEGMLNLVTKMIALINEDIQKYTPGFRERVLNIVRSRRKEIIEQDTQFEQTMSSLGIIVRKKPGAIEPVDVKVKRTVQILRQQPQKPYGPAEHQLPSESVAAILGLIDQAGKGFETSPQEFAKLREEGLRNVILGYLNAVFAINVATGETFSKSGRTDIFLNVPGGAVLIAECKIWQGAKAYTETIEQLFGYLVWRHTVGVLVTFSRNKGLTKVIKEAADTIQSHPSYQKGYSEKTSTYLISIHEHPADPEKTIELHHLFFDLYSESDRPV